jgi:hypothetical protein
MAKLSTVLSYDTNSKPVYHQSNFLLKFRIMEKGFQNSINEYVHLKLPLKI